MPGWTLILLHFSLVYIGSGKILKLLLSAHTNVHIQDRVEQDESGEVIVYPGSYYSNNVVNVNILYFSACADDVASLKLFNLTHLELYGKDDTEQEHNDKMAAQPGKTLASVRLVVALIISQL